MKLKILKYKKKTKIKTKIDIIIIKQQTFRKNSLRYKNNKK